MKSSSYVSDSIRNVEDSRESSLSTLFNWFLGLFFVLQVVIGVVIIVLFIGGELSKLQLDSVENELSSRTESLNVYLGDRLALLEGYSRMPPVVAGTMNPTANKANTADFIETLSMLKERTYFSLQDYSGNVIYSSSVIASFVGRGDAFEALIGGQRKHLVDVVSRISGGQEFRFWRLAVPVTYSGLPEGVLSAYIPLSIKAVSTAKDVEATRLEIKYKGHTAIAQGHAQAPTLTLTSESAFPDIGVTQEVSSQIVNKRVKYLVTVMIMTLLIGTSVLYMALRIAGRKFFVLPHDRLQALSDELEKEVEKRTEDLKHRTVQLSIEIREKREAEKEARETGQLVSALLEGVGGAFYIINPRTGKIVRTNSVVQTVFGISPSQLAGRRCDQAFADSPESVRRFLCPECIKNDAYSEGVIHRSDGQSSPVSRNLVPVEIDGEDHIGVMLLDITERKALERRLSIAQKLESVGELASGIAHEINTPIQYVGDSIRFLEEVFGDVGGVMAVQDELVAKCRSEGVHSELLERIDELSEDADLEFVMQEIPKACGRALDGTSRVAVIVRAMKNFAHPGDGMKSSVDINQALENTITVAKNEWKYVADVDTDFDPLPSIRCYAGDINQVFLNILINAAHAIEDVVGDSGVKGRIVVATRKFDERIEVRISDSGPGIEAANRDKIFDPFFTTKEVGRGTGQGLAIAHDVVVERHGGTIDVESAPGEGTTFVIGLPRE